MYLKIFNFKCYIKYLNHIFPTSGPDRGKRNQLAIYLGCNSGFISQVLREKVNFSLEHAEKLADFLKLDADEKQYLLLLVLLARAGSKSLAAHFEKQVEDIYLKKTAVSKNISRSDEVKSDAKAIYYSRWHYVAIHVLTANEAFDTPEKIATYLQISTRIVNDVLIFLCSEGLVAVQGGRYRIQRTRIHLDADSHLIYKHHENWRRRALEKIEWPAKDDIFFSATYSLSFTAVAEVRKLLLACIHKSEENIMTSKDEALYALNLDFFHLGS